MSEAIDLQRVFAALALVIALIILFVWLLRLWQRHGPSVGPAKRLQIVEMQSLGPRQRLILVRCDEREHLLAASPQEIRAIESWAARPAPSNETVTDEEATHGQI
ncbi:MAG: flagellar biosynthetic protein FliO [Geminicoccaceae bacterium]